ncbi:hypothetical protein CEXT_175291 [Caerostris extrusa]|uniref:Peptidase aspartic putative domain-containing protein n=1 Tax=Caerostris extrusa TaxID=172846 RepID=A0AAV4PT09_CAEEX|nr:hypothetical protein CEXT_175291 [Caerostris extrusa]
MPSVQTISPYNFMSRNSGKKCESVAGTKGSTTVQATMSIPSCMREVLLMTLMVEVVSGNMGKRVRCLLDCGSQRSYILRSTAEALHLKSLSSEKLTVAKV